VNNENLYSPGKPVATTWKGKKRKKERNKLTTKLRNIKTFVINVVQLPLKYERSFWRYDIWWHNVPTVRLVKQVSAVVDEVVKVIWQKGSIAATNGRFSRIRQVAPTCIPFNKSYILPWIHPSPHTKRLLDRVSPSSRQTVPILYNGPPLPYQNCPFAGGSGPHLMHGSLGPRESATQMASRSVQPFLQSSRSSQTNWPTDRQTDHTTPSVTTGRIYVVIRCGLIIIITIRKWPRRTRVSVEKVLWIKKIKEIQLDQSLCFTKHKLYAAALCTPITSGIDGMVPSAAAWRYLQPARYNAFSMVGNLPLVTLTFDLWSWHSNSSCPPSKGPNTSSVWILRKSVPRFPRYFIHKQTNKKVTDSAKNRTLRSSLRAVKMRKI